MDILQMKENLKNYYNIEAEFRNKNSIKTDWKLEVREKYLKLLKQENKKTLLELGAGTGYDSEYFKNNGLNVVAIDLSKEMVKKCIEKGIEAYELDFYNLSSLNRKFDGIYAINSLLHVPKNDLNNVLNGINSILQNNGLFYMGVYGGNDTESEYVKMEISEIPRFFTHNSENYLRAILDIIFQIITFEKIELENTGDIEYFYSITMKKK